MSNRFEEAVTEALCRMYDEAEPGLDFEEVRKNPDTVDDEWYRDHYLDSERQKEIVREVSDEYNLTDRQHSSFVTRTILDLGPSNVRE